MDNVKWIFVAVCLLLSGCTAARDTGQSAIQSQPAASVGSPDHGGISPAVAAPAALPDSLLESYYLSQDDPVYSYLQNNSIQRFFQMWLVEYLGEEIQGHWDYETLAPVLVLDHDFAPVTDPEVALYSCLFTTDSGECGYLIVSYSDNGPSVSKWSLRTTTPYRYDLGANGEQIAAALRETDIDLATATATRVEWIETDRNRGDRIILFEDGVGERYVCYLGDDDLSLEKQ